MVFGVASQPRRAPTAQDEVCLISAAKNGCPSWTVQLDEGPDTAGLYFVNILGRLSFAKNILAASKQRRAPNPIDGISI
jgi:hypothetical protein